MIPGERTDGSGAPAAPRPVPSGEGTDDAAERRRHDRQQSWRALDQGTVMSVELITATLVWFGAGWLLDRVLGTMPWFMFLGALLGNWAGLYLIWLRGQRAEEREAAATPPSGTGAAPHRSASGSTTRDAPNPDAPSPSTSRPAARSMATGTTAPASPQREAGVEADGTGDEVPPDQQPSPRTPTDGDR